MNKKKTLIIFVLLFITINVVIHIIINIDKAHRIKKALHQHVDNLQTHYNILLHHQKILANSIYKATFEIKGVFPLSK